MRQSSTAARQLTAVGAARARACSSRSLAVGLPQLLPPACRRRRRRWVGTRAAAAAVSSTAATLSAAAAPSASSKLQLLREASLERRAAATEFLADRFSAQFCDTLRRPLRAVGREAEYPVVWADGSAADVRLLLAEIGRDPRFVAQHEGGFDRLLSNSDTTQLVAMHGQVGGGGGGSNSGDSVEYILEVGWGTVEIVIGPCNDLFDLQRQHERAMFRLVTAASRIGMHVLGCGLQPRSAAGDHLMSPRNRYHTMKRAIGDAWESFTLTASDQLHVDVTRDEAIPFTNICNLLTPAVQALCANSPIHHGKASEFLCSREGLMRECGADHHRHSMPAGAFADMHDFIHTLGEMPFLMRPTESTGLWEIPEPQGMSFNDHAGRMDATDDEASPLFRNYLAHEHYVWHATRPRARQSTVELRAACQQPWSEHMAAAALQLGMVEAAADGTLQALFEGEFACEDGHEGAEAWNMMRSWHRQVVRHGLSPVQGRDADRLVSAVCDAAARGDADAVWGALSEAGEEREMALAPEKLIEISMLASQGDREGVRATLSEESIGAASQQGLDAPRLLERVVECCAAALERRGIGEEVFMDPLFSRLDKRLNPAQECLISAADGGMPALIAHCKVD